MSIFRRVGSRLPPPRVLVVGAVFTVMIGAVALLLVNSLVPFSPIKLKSYVVVPQTVCAGADVDAYVTRAYTTSFSSLHLEETWVTVSDVEGFGSNRPVLSFEGELPAAILEETDGFERVQSPLLEKAPMVPGVYRVRITAEAYGERLGFLPVSSEREFYSNKIRVIPCDGGR